MASPLRYWTIKELDEEVLQHTDIDEALEDYVDTHGIPDAVTTVTLVEMAPRQVTGVDKYRLTQRLAEDAFEWLAEEFGIEDNGDDAVLQYMQDALAEAVEQITAQAKLTSCEPTGVKHVVDVGEWVRTRHEDWAEENDDAV